LAISHCVCRTSLLCIESTLGSHSSHRYRVLKQLSADAARHLLSPEMIPVALLALASSVG
jgi:hypothetical protein